MQFPSRFGFVSDHPPCDPQGLAAFETSLASGRLPDDYRAFLLQWNGGYFPDIVNFPFKDEEDVFDFGSINSLEGLYDPSCQLDLRNNSSSYGFHPAVPSTYLAIGGLGWNQLCISTMGADFGYVYCWHPGEPWPEEPEPTTRALRPVSRSFQEFWRVLYRDE